MSDAGFEAHRPTLLALAYRIPHGLRGRAPRRETAAQMLIGDAGPNGGRFGKGRNVGRPVVGQSRVGALIRALAQQRVSPPAEFRERTLNGQPAVVAFPDAQPVLAVLVSVADGKIRHIFLHADPERLKRLGAVN